MANINNEPISLKSTLYYKKKKNKYLEKSAQFEILLLKNQKQKFVGLIKFDLANYAHSSSKRTLGK